MESRRMNLKIEFARKMALAYTAVCRPLCQEMKLPQTSSPVNDTKRAYIISIRNTTAMYSI